MELSNKKQKFIKRNAKEMSPEQMAEATGVALRDVKRIYRELGVFYEPGDQEPEEQSGLGAMFLTAAFIAFAALAPFFIRLRTYDFANLPQGAFVQGGALLLGALWMLDASIKKRLSFMGGPFLLPLGAFLVWCAISLFWAQNRYEGITTLMGWTACFGVLLLAPNLLKGERAPKAMLLALFLSGFAVALFGDLQHWGLHRHIPILAGVPQISPPSSVFANKNMAVPFVLLTMAIGFAWFLRSRKLLTGFLLGACLTLMLVYLVYTRTRAGWLAFGIMCLFFPALLLAARDRKGLGISVGAGKAAVSVALVLAAGLLVNVSEKGWDYNLGNMLRRVTYTAQEASRHILPGAGEEEKAVREGGALSPAVAAELEGMDLPKAVDVTPPGSSYDASQELRWAIWQNTLVMVEEHPILGVGLGNHKLMYPLYARRAVVEKLFSELSQLMNVHNDYLQALSETGLIGFLLLAWFAWVLIRTCLFLLRKASPDKKLMTMALMTGLLGLFVDAFFSFPFQRSIPPMVMAVFLGILSIWANDIRGRQPRELGFLPAPILAVALALLFVGAVRLQARWLAADRDYLRVTSLEKAARWDGVKHYANSCIEKNPYRAKVLSYLGRAYIETGDYKNGAETLEKVIAAYPNHMNALLNLGVAYGSIEEYDKALDAYKKVLAIKPDYAKAHNNLANVQMRMGQNKEAFRSFYLASLYDPENPVIRFNVGIMALTLAKYNTAAWAFEEALRIRPNWAPAEKNLGIVLFQNLDRKEEGLSHIQKAISLDPRMAGPGLGEPGEGVTTRIPARNGIPGVIPNR